MNCRPTAPADDRIDGLAGSVFFFSPMFSAARWMGLSSPASLREVIVRVCVAEANLVAVAVAVAVTAVVCLLRTVRSESIEAVDWNISQKSMKWPSFIYAGGRRGSCGDCDVMGLMTSRSGDGTDAVGWDRDGPDAVRGRRVGSGPQLACDVLEGYDANT